MVREWGRTGAQTHSGVQSPGWYREVLGSALR